LVAAGETAPLLAQPPEHGAEPTELCLLLVGARRASGPEEATEKTIPASRDPSPWWSSSRSSLSTSMSTSGVKYSRLVTRPVNTL